MKRSKFCKIYIQRLIFIYVYFSQSINNFPSFSSDSAGTTNGCSTNNGGCPHLCLPKPENQKTCACTTGFYPSHDGSRCEEYESFAVVSTSEYIRGFHINSSDHSEAMVPVGRCMSMICCFACWFSGVFLKLPLMAGGI